MRILQNKKTGTRRIGEAGVLERLADPKVRARLDKALRHWERKTRVLVKAVRSSEQLNEKDLAIRINTKG
jgi:hypothetical protein